MVAAIVGVVASVSLSGAAGTQSPPEVVDVTAERFSFTPSEIKVKAGTRLEIRLSSEDTDHGFRIPGTDVDVRIPKRNRGTTTVTFDAAKPGRYSFQCSHVCGAGHSFMRGEIVVTE
jgi:cytochrome c oxidase subunit II